MQSRNYFLAVLCSTLVLFSVSGPMLRAQQSTAPLTTDQILQSLDPDMRNVIMLYDSIKGTHIDQLTPQDARQQFSVLDAAKIIARGAAGAPSATPVGKVIDGITFPSDGAQIPIRLYYPAGNGPFPVILYFHGGGFVIATNDTYDESARSLCNYANALVVSVEYRKAPEAPFPAAYDDAIAAYRWVLANINTYDGFPTKVAVAGESAGGTLATEVALTAKAQGMQLPTHELLIYPIISASLDQLTDQAYTDSSLPLYTALLPYFGSQYLPTGADLTDPRVFPLNNSLVGLPPTTIIAAQDDPLTSDGDAYYATLLEAKVPVTYQFYTGTTHEFFGMGAVVSKAKAAEQFGAAQIAASFK